jgi:hypothetical protein
MISVRTHIQHMTAGRKAPAQALCVVQQALRSNGDAAAVGDYRRGRAMRQ